MSNFFNFNTTLFGSTSSSGSSMLTDYMSIQNGSYKKMLKAYYKNEAESTTKTNSNSSKNDLSKLETNELVTAKSEADSLKSSANKLVTTSSKSLFKSTKKVETDESGIEKTVDVYDRDAITAAIKQFAEDYNSVIKSSLTPSNAQMTKKAALMINTTKMNSTLLNDVGIKIGSDYKLTIDEEKLKKADISTLKTLFNGAGSYASEVSQKAGDISSIASKVIANTTKGYSSTGGYLMNGTTGSLFNGFF